MPTSLSGSTPRKTFHLVCKNSLPYGLPFLVVSTPTPPFQLYLFYSITHKSFTEDGWETNSNKVTHKFEEITNERATTRTQYSLMEEEREKKTRRTCYRSLNKERLLLI